MNLLSSLTHRSFTILWTGQSISRLGDHIHSIALAWWIVEKTGSAAAMGAVLIFSQVPMLVFLLVGGIAVDRVSRTQIMIVSDVLRGVTVAGIAFLAFTGLLEIWHLLGLGVIYGSVNAFFQPAYTALIPDIVPRDFLASANSLTSLSGQLSGVIGPAIGAALVVFGGTPTAFALDALSFFFSAICLVPIVGLSNARAEKLPSALNDLREGLAAVFASPWLWMTITVFAFANVTLAGPMSAALPFLVKENLRWDASGLGMISSAGAVGSILAAIYLGRFKKMRRRGILTYGSALVGCFALFSMGFAINIFIVAFASLVFGFTVSFFGLIWTNTLQEMIPRDLLGRVSSIDMLGSFVLLPIGFGVTGWATDLIGAANVFFGWHIERGFGFARSLASSGSWIGLKVESQEMRVPPAHRAIAQLDAANHADCRHVHRITTAAREYLMR